MERDVGGGAAVVEAVLEFDSEDQARCDLEIAIELNSEYSFVFSLQFDDPVCNRACQVFNLLWHCQIVAHPLQKHLCLDC